MVRRVPCMDKPVPVQGGWYVYFTHVSCNERTSCALHILMTQLFGPCHAAEHMAEQCWHAAVAKDTTE